MVRQVAKSLDELRHVLDDLIFLFLFLVKVSTKNSPQNLDFLESYMPQETKTEIRQVIAAL